MRDFDEERHQQALDAEDREFQIGGRAFRAAESARPEVLAPYNDLVTRIANSEAVPDGEVLAVLDETILALLEHDGGWREVRASDDDPISVRFMWRIAGFCIEAVSGRPLTQRSPDGGTPESPGTSSTLDSSSPVTPALVLST